jgi:hypothetical protein
VDWSQTKQHIASPRRPVPAGSRTADRTSRDTLAIGMGALVSSTRNASYPM